MLMIRKAKKQDAEGLKELYLGHLTKYPPVQEQNLEDWSAFIEEFERDGHYYLLVGELDNQIVSSVTLIIIKNLTHNMRPYAVIENVVTHVDYRGRHFATEMMKYASEIAGQHGCYKIMLMTGSKRESTLKFYENCGFSKDEKTAFLKKL